MPQPPASGGLGTNKEIEDAAVSWVLDLERQAGRDPIDKRYDPAFPADIESRPRLIEVKAAGVSQRGWFLPMEIAQVDRARRDEHFYVYVVENVRQGDPTKFRLKVLYGNQLQRLLQHAREKRYYEVPFRVEEYEAAPGIEAIKLGTDKANG